MGAMSLVVKEPIKQKRQAIVPGNPLMQKTGNTECDFYQHPLKNKWVFWNKQSPKLHKV